MRIILFIVGLCVALVAAKNGRLNQRMLDVLMDFREYGLNRLEASGLPYAPNTEYPWFNFLPQYLNSFPTSGRTTRWASACFNSNSGSIKLSDDGKQILLSITSTGPTADIHCSDDYIVFTASSVKDFIISSKGPVPVISTDVVVDIPEDITDAEQWYFQSRGLRLYKFVNSPAETISNLIKTVELFTPDFTGHVSDHSAAINIDFMKKYAKFEVSARDPAATQPPDEKDVHSGDAFGIMRLDGLNPMLAWAMGSTTGHTTTALWIDGELYVCESTIADSYWPTDYVQKTPYRKWLQQAKDADFQVVWTPLDEASRKAYNETAAIEFFNSVEGLDYGYKTMIWAWIDTAADNFPCLPPTFSAGNCMTWDMFEPILALVDRKFPDIGQLIWNSGLAMRLGVSDTLRTTELYKVSEERGLPITKLITMPELDTYIYNTTRFGEPALGKNMVCCVFVCNMWKAAGVFGNITNEINCGEMTDWDDFSLTILAEKNLQIIGDYTLELNDYHTKAPYAHMAENCPSLAPDYVRSPTC